MSTVFVAVVESPAPFFEVHVAVCEAPSFGRDVDEQLVAIPLSLSVVVQLTVTGAVYQPLLPSVPTTVGATSGGVSSILTVTDSVAEPPAEVALHVNVSPAW